MTDQRWVCSSPPEDPGARGCGEVDMIDWRRGLRWIGSLAGFAVPVLLLSTGCSTLGFLRSREKPAEEKVDQPSTTHRADIPSLPGKYSFRVAPYVFLSDFEIRKDQPLFQ